MTEEMEIQKRFAAHPAVLHDVREFVRAEGIALRSGVEVEDLVLAVSEACGNVVRHTWSGAFELRLRRSAEAVEVEVRDEGVFRNRERPVDPGPSVDGYGIPLMRSLVDECDIRRGTDRRPGTIVRLVMYGRRGPGGSSVTGPVTYQEAQTSRR